MSDESRATDVAEVLSDLGAGAFEQQLAMALSNVALGVVEHMKDGKVTITLQMRQVGDGSQITCQHKLEYQQPTSKGSMREDVTGKTPLYVNRGGRLTLFPEHQGQLLGKHGETETNE